MVFKKVNIASLWQDFNFYLIFELVVEAYQGAIKLINDAMLKYKLMTEAFTRLGYRGNVY